VGILKLKRYRASYLWTRYPSETPRSEDCVYLEALCLEDAKVLARYRIEVYNHGEYKVHTVEEVVGDAESDGAAVKEEGKEKRLVWRTRRCVRVRDAEKDRLETKW